MKWSGKLSRVKMSAKKNGALDSSPLHLEVAAMSEKEIIRRAATSALTFMTFS